MKHGEAAKKRPANLCLEPGGYGLVTLHRPSNVDDPELLESLLGALGQVAEMIPLIYPVHPRARDMVEASAVHPHLRMFDRQGYLDFLVLEACARLVLTDSRAVQVETTFLGVPYHTHPGTAECPSTITNWTNRVEGLDHASMTGSARQVLSQGKALVPRIVDGEGCRSHRSRPRVALCGRLLSVTPDGAAVC